MKTQFEVNEDFRVMENEELVYMLTKKNDFSQKAAEDLFGYPNTSSFSDVISQMTPAKRRLAMAAVELYKRLRENAAEPQKIMCSQDIYKLMYPYLGDIATEECWAGIPEPGITSYKKISCFVWRIFSHTSGYKGNSSRSTSEPSR